MKIAKYSMGVGDRFGRQGAAQLSAFVKAAAEGVQVAPVWNKSFREHSIIGTTPDAVREAADAAVAAVGWDGEYYVDADHIGLATVDAFMGCSDFFTLDVADFTGERASDADIVAFVAACEGLCGEVTIPGIDEPLAIAEKDVEAAAGKYLLAVQEAGRIFRHIDAARGAANCIIEVSMDETDEPQTPTELLFILAAIAREGIPAQTIAPKFTGRFNKGVDYVGDVSRFAAEFEQDLAVVRFATQAFNMAGNLKLSVHSGSDKFSIYPCIAAALKHFDAGLHLKTAGTTWLEELIGLAAAGGSGLAIAKEVYAKAYARYEELCGPYATVIDIDPSQLPAVETVAGWSSEAYASALRHDLGCPVYNPNLRQLLHVGYKIAAELGETYRSALHEHREVVAQNVAENIHDRHLIPVFGG